MEKDKIKINLLNNQKRLKINEMHYLIDRLMSLNDIFQLSLNEYIMFEESDKIEYKHLINYLFLKFDMNSTKMVILKDYHINLSYKFYKHRDVLKLIAFLLYLLNVAYSFQTNNIKFLSYFDVLIKIIDKLSKDKYLNENDVCFFIKYLMVLTTFNPNENYRVGKSIKKLMVFWMALNFFTTFFKENVFENKIALIDDMVSFIDSKFLVNNLNLIILSKSTQFLTLLEIIKTDTESNSYINLFQLISKIYSIQYNLKQHKAIISGINNDLSSNNTYKNLAVNLKFLNILCLPFNNILPIKNGFFFTNQPESGIKLSTIIMFPNKGYTILFSFKSISSNDLPEQTILSLKETETNSRDKDIKKENDFYRIFIKDKFLNIQIHDDLYTISEFSLNKDQLYIVTIVQEGQGVWGGKTRFSVIFNDLKDRFEKHMTYPKGKKIQGTIGFYESIQSINEIKNDNDKVEKEKKIERESIKYVDKSHFYGIFGSLFIFEEPFKEQLLSKIFKLGEDYELLLYRNYQFLNKLDYNKQEILKSIAESDNYKLENKLISLVSPKAVFDSFKKNNTFKLREDYANFNINNLVVSRRKFEILSNTCIFNVFKFHTNFTNYEGIPFLCYILKNIFNNLNNSKTSPTENEIDMIWSIIISVIEISFIIILNDDKVGKANEKFIYLFYQYLSAIIEKVTVTKTISLTTFENIIKYLYLFDNFSNNKEMVFFLKIKYCELIFDDRLYDTFNYNILVYIHFQRYIETVQTNLISIKTFTKLLNFSKNIFNGDQININKNLKNQLSDTIKKFIYICFSENKMKIILELVIFAIESKFHIYRCYKLLKIFYLILLEKENFKRDFLNEIIKLKRHEGFVIKVYSLIDFFNNDMQADASPYIEKICSLCIRIIDIFYFMQQEKTIHNFTIYKENQKSRFIVFQNIMDQIHPIRTTFLAKSLVLVIIDKKESAVLGDFNNLKDNKNIQLISLQNNMTFHIEPLKILTDNLEKFVEVDTLNCIISNLTQIFLTICMKVSKSYYSQHEKESISYSILTPKNICQCFFNYILLTQSIIQNIDIKNILANIIKTTINSHSKPFYFELLINLYLERYQNNFIVDILNEILFNLIQNIKYEGESRPFNYNLIYLMFLLYEMVIHNFNKTIYSDIFKTESFLKFYLEFVNLILQTQIIYYYNRVFKLRGDNHFQTLYETYFDLNFHLYCITKNEKFLKLIENVFLLKSGNFTNKLKGETYPGVLDKYFRLNKNTNYINIDIKKLKKYDSIFFEERENKSNFILMELLTKFICFNNFFSDKRTGLQKKHTKIENSVPINNDFTGLIKRTNTHSFENIYGINYTNQDMFFEVNDSKIDKIHKDFLQILIISTCKDITNSFYRADIFTNLYNLGNNKNIEINTFTQIITNEMYSYFEKNKTCFLSSNPINQQTDKEDCNKLLLYFSDVIKNNLKFYKKYLKINHLKRSSKRDQIEMKMVKSNILINFEKDFPQKFIFNESYLPQLYDDKAIDDIENSLNLTIYSTNKTLEKIQLGFFFREKYISDEYFSKIIVGAFKRIFEMTNSKNVIDDNHFKTEVYLKMKNHFITGRTYFRPFMKPIFNYSHSKYFELTHSYLKDKIQEVKNSQIVNEKKMNFNIKSEIIYEQNCENITNEGVYFGNLYVTHKYLIFDSILEPQYDDKQSIDLIFGSLKTDIIKKKKTILIDFKDIKEILARRFLLMWQAIEIFLNNGKSYYLNLFKIKLCQNLLELFKILKKENSELNFHVIRNSAKYFKKNDYTRKWLEGELTNFDYLCLVNKYSGRSFQDLSQYPVFPWVIADYKSPILNLEDKKTFRNLCFPVTIQTESRKKYIMDKYDCELEPQVHFRIHYSTSHIVSLFLLRLQPFTNNSIKLQSGQFDNPDRIFYNMGETYTALENSLDNRELTPEFFYCPEITINNNLYYMGKRTNNSLVNNFLLPNWASSPVDFIHKHRLALESKYVSENLNYWIDNIFGSNQLIRNRESMNVFPNSTYEQETKLDKFLEGLIANNTDINTINNEINNKKDIILNLGQTPHKLFEEKHPRKLNHINNKEDLYSFVDNNSKNKTGNIISFPKGVKYFNYSKNYYYILTTQKEVEVYDKYLKKKTKVRLKVQEKSSIYKKEIMNTKAKIQLTKEKYRIIELKDCKYFISCGHLDNSFKVYTNENIFDYQFNSLVTCLLKTNDENILYTGHSNGKISILSINFSQNSNIMFTHENEFVNHDEAINCILHDQRLGLLITGSDDGYVAIRNLYNYEVINFIMPKIDQKDNRKYKIIDIKISEFNWLYILAFDFESFYLFGYTLSGIKFSHHKGLINNFEITPNQGNLIVGYYNNKISVLNAVDFKPLYDKSLDDIHSYLLYHFSSSNEPYKPFYLCYSDGNWRRFYVEEEKEKIYFE